MFCANILFYGYFAYYVCVFSFVVAVVSDSDGMNNIWRSTFFLENEWDGEVGCCCSPFSLVHLSPVLLPRDSGVSGRHPLVCSINPTVSFRWMSREIEEMLNIMWCPATDVETSILIYNNNKCLKSNIQ